MEFEDTGEEAGHKQHQQVTLYPLVDVVDDGDGGPPPSPSFRLS
jgi:hypothetical protein